MKRFLTVIIILCGISVINANSNVNSESDCSWNVYEKNITKDGWALCISYDNRCDFSIRVKVRYKMAYKARYCDDDWSYETVTEYYDLQPNRGSHWLIGNYGSSYDDCTKRYNLIFAKRIDD
jgi:hypothetical protein